MQASCVDDTFAKFTGFGAAYLRAIESMRSDRSLTIRFNASYAPESCGARKALTYDVKTE
ncbi:hypothetical protein GQ600_3869 [Phytophthora cactorum]|nr:hypothetical protein GQ600_3869 [Phytophthora cactorum]